MPVAAVAGLILGLSTGSEPFGAAVLFGVIAAVVVSSDASAAARRSSLLGVAGFLYDMRDDGIIDAATYSRLIDELRMRGYPAPEETPAPSNAAQPVRGAVAETAADSVPAPAPEIARASPVVAPPEQAEPLMRRRAAAVVATSRRKVGAMPGVEALRRFWTSLASDFAVQGLGSLGVLLVFTGTLGFVLFAFSEVGAGLRPAAELLVPIVLLALTAFLYRRDARFVAAAMEFLTGAVLPVMAFAAFVDGAPAPPDLDGVALVVALAATSLALAAGYAAVARRRPVSPLRYLVAPLVWLTVGVLGLAIDAGPSALQMALVTAAVGATAWLIRLMPSSPVTAATGRVLGPGLVIGYASTLVFAIGEGWAPLPVLVAGLVVAVAVERIDVPLPLPWIVQASVVAISAFFGGNTWPGGWVGVGAASSFLLLAERWGYRSETERAVPVMLAGAGAATIAAASDPASLASAAAVLSVWSHLRRVAPLTTGTSAPTVAAAALAPIGVVVGIGGLVGSGPALLIGAVAVAVGSLAARRWLPGDGFYALWLPSVAILLALSTAVSAAVGADELLHSAAIALCVVPIGISWIPVGGRVWLSAAMIGGAAHLAAPTFGLGVQSQVLVAAAVGAALVGVGAQRSDRAGGHLALLGHVVNAGAVAVAADQSAPADWMSERQLIATAMAAWAAGWLVEVVAGGAAPLSRLFAAHRRVAAHIADAVLVLTLPILAVLSADLVVSAGLPMSGIVASAPLGVAYVSAGRRLPGRPWLQTMLFSTGVALTIGAALLSTTLDVLVADDRWAMVGSFAAVAVAVVAVPVQVRSAWMEWAAWAATAPLTYVVAIAAGLAPGARHWAWFAWGAVAACGALLADDLRNGRRQPGSLTSERWLVPPVALGVALAGLALVPASAVTFAQLYVPSLAAAALSLVLALQLRIGAMSTLTWAAATVAYASLFQQAGWSLATEPWPLVLPAVIACAAGLCFSSSRSFAERWDLPAFAVAAATGAVTVVFGFLADATASTWLPIGAACLAFAAVRRVPALAIPGAVLVLGAASLASPAWFAAALAATSLATGFAAVAVPRAQRPLQWISALTGGGAWAYGLVAAHATVEVAAGVTLAASAATAVGAAVTTARGADLDWAASRPGPWVAVAAGGLATSLLLVAPDPASRLLWVACAALLGWSVSAAISATALDVDLLRTATVGLGVAALAAAGLALELTGFGWVALATSSAMVLTVLALAMQRRTVANRWVRHVVGAVLAIDVAAALLAFELIPDRTALTLVVLAGAAQALATGIVTDRAGILKVAPPLLFIAWVLSLGESLLGEVQWVTTPGALALLAIVEIGRWDRRRTATMPVTSEELRLTELAALGLLAGPALFQTMFVAVPFGVLAVVQGVVVAVWGAATHVRRRVYLGVSAAVLGALLMVAVPLAALLPEIRGIALWVALGTIGAVLLAVAATIEQARRKVADVRATWSDATEGWE